MPEHAGRAATQRGNARRFAQRQRDLRANGADYREASCAQARLPRCRGFWGSSSGGALAGSIWPMLSSPGKKGLSWFGCLVALATGTSFIRLLY